MTGFYNLDLWVEFLDDLLKSIHPLIALTISVAVAIKYKYKNKITSPLYFLLLTAGILIFIRAVLFFPEIIVLSKRYFMPLAVVTCLLGGYGLQQLFSISPERHLKKLRWLVLLVALGLSVSGIRYNRLNPYLEAASVIHTISPDRCFVLTNTNLDRCRYYIGSNVEKIPDNNSVVKMNELLSQETDKAVFILLQETGEGSEVWLEKLLSAKCIELLDEFKGKKAYYRLYQSVL